MAKAVKVCSKGEVERFSEAIAKLSEPGDYATVVRGVPRSIVMRCPDGCGETITVNLDRRAGPAWRKYVRADLMTIYPSVWRESGCEAHFIVWNNKIVWCGPREEPASFAIDDQLLDQVLSILPTVGGVHYEDVAETAGLIPWDVHWVCRHLVSVGAAVQATKGYFRKK